MILSAVALSTLAILEVKQQKNIKPTVSQPVSSIRPNAQKAEVIPAEAATHISRSSTLHPRRMNSEVQRIGNAKPGVTLTSPHIDYI